MTLTITFLGCKKESSSSLIDGTIVVSTIAATNITSVSVKSGVIITNSNNNIIISSGLCWSTSPSPNLLNLHTTDTISNGTFAKKITNLIPATTYYIRAYVRTISDTLYGNEISITTPNQHIYICGSEIIGSKHIAKLWKNGISSSLSNGLQNASAESVFVLGNDVYVAGYESNGTHNVAKFWKNGVATNLTNGNNDAVAYSIVVSNNVVYIAGYESNGNKKIAKIWVNGIATNLTNGTYDAVVRSIVLANNKIYACGFESDGMQGNQAKIWTNGVPNNMTNGLYTSEAISIFVSGTDVYVTGFLAPSYANDYVILWKNGQEMQIDQGSFFFGLGKSVFVEDNDVHLVGSTDDKGASWWKNGRAMALTSNSLSRANAIQVVGGTAYIAGTKFANDVVNGNDVAAYWVDNLLVTLPHTGIYSYANSIFVQ
ncbi:MAG: hypothetical protein KA319_09490 [Ferruginibacter sp.]|nr:hypothetical protein [Ferruginibacter sp.]